VTEGKGDYKGADPEDADEYRAEYVFFVPFFARRSDPFVLDDFKFFNGH